jgi:hypothetical protein
MYSRLMHSYGDVLESLREQLANLLFGGSNPSISSIFLTSEFLCQYY